MSIRTRPSKKAKKGYTYQVYFPYKDISGATKIYHKGGFLTKKEAELHQAKMKNELSEFGEIFEPVEKTVNEVFNEYMQLKEKKYAKATFIYYNSTYRNLVKYPFGNRKIKTIRRSELSESLNSMKSLASAKNAKKVWSVILKYSIQQGYIKYNPLQYVELSYDLKDYANHDILSYDQIKELADRVRNVDSKHCPNKEDNQFNCYAYSIAIMIGYFCGFRLSETLGLYKSDFDFTNNTINLQRRLEYHGLKKDQYYTTTKMKTRESKAIVPMAEPLKAILLNWFDYNPYDKVICDINGNFINVGSMTSRIHMASKKMGINFHYHMLRHIFISNLAMSDAPVAVIKQLARHSDITTTMNVYTHVDEKSQKEVIDQVFNKKKDGDNHGNV